MYVLYTLLIDCDSVLIQQPQGKLLNSSQTINMPN